MRCWQHVVVEALLAPVGPNKSGTMVGWLEQVSGQCQVKVGASWGLIDPLMVTSSSGGGGQGRCLAPRH